MSANEFLSQAELDAALAALQEDSGDSGTAFAAAPAEPEPVVAAAAAAAAPVAAAPVAPAPPAPRPAAPVSSGGAPMWTSLDSEVNGTSANAPNLDIVMDIPLEVSVELGRKRMSIRDILDLGAGSIVELDKVAGEPVDLLVNGRLVARGEVVVIEDNFGVRITEIIGAAARAAASASTNPAVHA